MKAKKGPPVGGGKRERAYRHQKKKERIKIPAKRNQGCKERGEAKSNLMRRRKAERGAPTSRKGSREELVIISGEKKKIIGREGNTLGGRNQPTISEDRRPGFITGRRRNCR